jgi:hypothetical protein
MTKKGDILRAGDYKKKLNKKLTKTAFLNKKKTFFNKNTIN